MLGRHALTFDHHPRVIVEVSEYRLWIVQEPVKGRVLAQCEQNRQRIDAIGDVFKLGFAGIMCDIEIFDVVDDLECDA